MKEIALFFLAVGIIITSNAQTKFGLKAGVNVSTIVGEDVVDDVNSQAGFYTGGTANIVVGEKFSVQPELLFSTKGYNYDVLGEKVTSTFSYLAVPVLAKYNTQSGFYAETGPQLAFLLAAKIKANGIPDGEDDNKDSFKPSAFSWCLGLGYNLKSGLGFGARYNFGLSSIPENSNIDSKFNILRLGLSWTFGCDPKKEK